MKVGNVYRFTRIDSGQKSPCFGCRREHQDKKDFDSKLGLLNEVCADCPRRLAYLQKYCGVPSPATEYAAT